TRIESVCMGPRAAAGVTGVSVVTMEFIGEKFSVFSLKFSGRERIRSQCQFPGSSLKTEH
ncbi:MAG TPA: hypothetical protein VIM46_07895, partial [Luteolibacter sp.]